MIPFHCTGMAKRDSQFLPPGKGMINLQLLFLVDCPYIIGI